MTSSRPIDRRAFLQGIGGVALALPVLDAMGAEVTGQIPRRFCALYTANGMSLPRPEHGIDEWSWFPTAERDGEFVLRQVDRAARARSASSSASWAGCIIPNGPKADPHVCSDMWLTGAPLHNPKPGTYNSVGARPGDRAAHQAVLPAAVAGAVDRRRDRLPLADRHDLLQPRRAGRSRRRTTRAASSTACSAATARRCSRSASSCKRRIKLVDAVAESAKSLDQQLGKSDRERMDQYLTSLNEVESRLIASETWIDIPLKKQDYSHLNLDATNEGEPAEYYRNMFDLIALAFDADITRSVTFMLNREDGMGISDTFPLKLGLPKTHHNLSHATDKEGQLAFAKYDLFLSQQIAHFLERLNEYQDRDGSVLDNTIVLFGSGASTTHNPRNLPTLIAGGASMGLKHGTYWRTGETRMSNVYLSILHSLGIEQESFADSTGTLSNSLFRRA